MHAGSYEATAWAVVALLLSKTIVCPVTAGSRTFWRWTNQDRAAGSMGDGLLSVGVGGGNV